jgi:hypothetical protein
MKTKNLDEDDANQWFVRQHREIVHSQSASIFQPTAMDKQPRACVNSDFGRH